MKVLFVTSEAQPFAASGGLGDVAGALPRALRIRLIGCRVVMPLYEDIPAKMRAEMQFVTSFSVPVAWRRQYCGVFEARHNGVIYYLLDNQYYFKRSGLYGHYDDAERFAFLSRAALEMLRYIDFKPDIIHSNDWQTALLPVYHSLFYAGGELYRDIKTVFTIHNIQYQGKYGLELLEDVIGVPVSQRRVVEFDDCVNFMKGAIECANMVTTVSPTYAKEILNPWFSHGLDPILAERSFKLRGIVNGIDTEMYNPETDPALAVNYSVDEFTGKKANKSDLQKALGLPEREDAPLVGMVTRLVAHKGMDLLKYALEEILAGDVQIVLLGSGDYEYEDFFGRISAKYPSKFKFRVGFIPELAHKIYAGADIFLMPSKSEPCGLSQMVALRYGTIPVVRETGGLSDTIQDEGDGKGNGFTFKTYNASDMTGALTRAFGCFENKEYWPVLVERAMRCDNSWGRSANDYIRLYRELTQK